MNEAPSESYSIQLLMLKRKTAQAFSSFDWIYERKLSQKNILYVLLSKPIHSFLNREHSRILAVNIYTVLNALRNKRNMEDKNVASNVLGDTFMYFAYGSNLHEKRIHLNNPTAKFVSIGKLEDYRLDYVTESKFWNGASATIVPEKGEHVWGAIWEINMVDYANLDRQEGVEKKLYYGKFEPIVLPDGKVISCRVFQQTIDPPPIAQGEERPIDRRPSVTYRKVILEGAIQCGIPIEYIEKLKLIQDNGREAVADIVKVLN